MHAKDHHIFYASSGGSIPQSPNVYRKSEPHSTGHRLPPFVQHSPRQPFSISSMHSLASFTPSSSHERSALSISKGNKLTKH